MKILLLMQWFDPEPQIKGLLFAKKLQSMGHDVEVLTGFPNYPGGNIYPGYSIKIFQKELMEGVSILRVPLFPSHDSSAFGRVLNYITFGISSFFAGLWAAREKDVIYACGPPVTVGVSAAIISMIRCVPFVYDIQDIWPDSLKATGMFTNPYGLKIVSVICNWLYKRASNITVQSKGVSDNLRLRGVNEEKIKIICNWCNETSLFKHSLPNLKKNTPSYWPQSSKENFDILFAGNIGKAQDMDTILDAAYLLINENKRIRILIIGDGVELIRIKKSSFERKLNNIFFLPRVTIAEVGLALDYADALIVHLKADPLFSMTIPAKTQAYMAAGKPIIMAVDGEASKLVTDSGAGVAAKSGDARSIADAIKKIALSERKLLMKMGNNGSEYYRANMSLEIGAQKFLEVFKSAIYKNANF